MLTQGQTRWSILPSNAMADLSPLRTLSRSFLAGEPTVEQIMARGTRILGRSWPWLRPVAQRYVKTFSDRTRPRHQDVVQFLLDDPRFARAWSRHFHEFSGRRGERLRAMFERIRWPGWSEGTGVLNLIPFCELTAGSEFRGGLGGCAGSLKTNGSGKGWRTVFCPTWFPRAGAGGRQRS